MTTMVHHEFHNAFSKNLVPMQGARRYTTFFYFNCFVEEMGEQKGLFFILYLDFCGGRGGVFFYLNYSLLVGGCMKWWKYLFILDSYTAQVSYEGNFPHETVVIFGVYMLTIFEYMCRSHF